MIIQSTAVSEINLRGCRVSRAVENAMVEVEGEDPTVKEGFKNIRNRRDLEEKQVMEGLGGKTVHIWLVRWLSG